MPTNDAKGLENLSRGMRVAEFQNISPPPLPHDHFKPTLLKITVGIEGELANKNVWFLTHRLDEELIELSTKVLVMTTKHILLVFECIN